tara:strand:- start:898 stop:1374 length:477 start_codon:yes stop_codon:yes gene_type:complete
MAESPTSLPLARAGVAKFNYIFYGKDRNPCKFTGSKEFKEDLVDRKLLKMKYKMCKNEIRIFNCQGLIEYWKFVLFDFEYFHTANLKHLLYLEENGDQETKMEIKRFVTGYYNLKKAIEENERLLNDAAEKQLELAKKLFDMTCKKYNKTPEDLGVSM